MPDPNKMDALQVAGFRVVPTCLTCVCFRRSNRRAIWGLCSAIRYDHEKHNEKDRKTGVPNNGWCPQYELSPEDLEDQVESYTRFFEPDSHAE